MKRLKPILNYIFALLLVLSVTFNIVFLSLFEIWNPAEFKKLIVMQAFYSELDQSEEGTTATPEAETPEAESPTPAVSAFAYSDDYVRLRMLKQEATLLGYAVSFEVQNIGNKALDITFDNIIIDGYQISSSNLSGFYVSDLAAGNKAIGELHLYESDYEAFATKPKEVSFAIKISDSESWDTLYTSKQLDPIKID